MQRKASTNLLLSIIITRRLWKLHETGPRPCEFFFLLIYCTCIPEKVYPYFVIHIFISFFFRFVTFFPFLHVFPNIHTCILLFIFLYRFLEDSIGPSHFPNYLPWAPIFVLIFLSFFALDLHQFNCYELPFVWFIVFLLLPLFAALYHLDSLNRSWPDSQKWLTVLFCLWHITLVAVSSHTGDILKVNVFLRFGTWNMYFYLCILTSMLR